MAINNDHELTLQEHLEITRRKFEMTAEKHSEKISLYELKRELNIPEMKNKK